MNEPLPGYIPPPAFEAGFLYPFYRRAIESITTRGGDSRHAVFFEPAAVRNLTDVALQASTPFSLYPNLVYAPHVYTHVFTADTAVPGASALPYPLSYDQAYQSAEVEARSMNAAMFIGEYGDDPSQDASILSAATAAQERARVGSTLWNWNQNCGLGSAPPPGPCTGQPWGVLAPDPGSPPAHDLGVRPGRSALLARAWPRASTGSLDGWSYDPGPGRHSFSMTATYTADGDGPPAVVYLPPAATGTVTTSGATGPAQITTEPDGSRLVTTTPSGKGTYGLAVAATG
ncbi:MAG: cellulase family glycosylhydrolase [Acidimicrobiales bacterium]